MDKHKKTEEGAKSEEQLTCVVMKGIPVDKEEAIRMGWVREYKGKKYYFCCSSCPDSFDASPEEYTQ